ncbi:MAG: hypothetical protein C0608_11800 [Deltaproteobacteria bacterium]|nr:MAG: hypothetical protein C0608_11800 [Deltaproteobacteria bacterium]
MTKDPTSNKNHPPREIWVLCKVPREEIFYMRYNLEAYEGVGIPTTLPGREGLVKVITTEEQRKELEEILIAFADDISLEIIEWGAND